MPDSSRSQPSIPNRHGLTVGEAESGMKLLRFLERRLGGGVPRSALYKWVRTGQVRVNGGRAEPHDVLTRNDVVRIPPFAALRPVEDAAPSSGPCPASDAATDPEIVLPDGSGAGSHGLKLGPGLCVLAKTGDVLVLNKGAGLASQPGRGDSVAARLATAFQDKAFVPAPAHRLDKHTSGLMVAGLSHRTQQGLHALIGEGGMVKEYLAWTVGRAGYEQPTLLEDTLYVAREGAREVTAAHPDRAADRVLAPGAAAMPSGRLWPVSGSDAAGGGGALRQGNPGKARNGDALGGQLAVCVAVRVGGLGPRELPDALRGLPEATLLLVRLVTGRKHQIRVQLASRGLPLIGDGRYGGPHFARMLLQSYRLGFRAPGSGEPLSFCAPPDWPDPFPPEAADVAAASERLKRVFG